MTPSSAAPLKLETLTEADYAEWDAYVDAHPKSNVYHLSAWNTIARDAYGIANSLTVVRDSNHAILGGLPLFFPKRLGKTYVINGIFGSYGSFLADSAEAEKLLLDHAIKATKDKEATFLHLKTMNTPEFNTELTHSALVKQIVWVTALLDLPQTSDSLFKQLDSSMRAKVRKAQKNNIEVRFSRSEADYQAFYEVLAMNMKRKGSPMYGHAFLNGMMKAFGEKIEVATLWLNGQCISGGQVLRYKNVVYIPFVSSRPESFPLRPNNLLYWSILARACDSGAKRADFGTSLKGASTLGFKLSWGTSLYDLPSYVHSPQGTPIELAPKGAVQLGVSLWKVLPLFITDRLGPKICAMMV